jgi:Uri superfamily endonuclease
MKVEGIPFPRIPRQPGTYVLIMRLASPTEVEVGKLGSFDCAAGWYAYVGSARASGGLAGRLNRHRQRSKRLHWHIDYLLAASGLTEIWWAVSPERWECGWAEALSRLAGTTMPVPGFGASDCHCPTHLLRFVHRPSLSALSAQLERRCAVRLTVLTCRLTMC